jgi:hypothetical protein
MSVFGSIASGIFGSSHSASTTPGAQSSPATPSSARPSMGFATAKPISQSELQGLIQNLAASQGEKLDWQKSIVDLMKLLKLDSSLGEREKLARELGYTGALNGSADMNIWLHKQVMTKLAERGGNVPESLKV